MKTSYNFVDQAANKFLDAIKYKNPPLYQNIMGNKNNMSGLAGLWDDIKAGFNNVTSAGAEIYGNQQNAEAAKAIAQEEAKKAIIETQALITNAQLQSKNLETQAELERQKLDLQKELRAMEFSNTQKTLLGLGAGLLALLFIMKV